MEVYDIKEYIIRHYRPSCIVFATPEAAKMCTENNLTPAELLRPFADMRKEQIIFNSFEKSAYVLKDFVVDLFDSEEYEQAPEQQREICRKVLDLTPPYFSFEDVPSFFGRWATIFHPLSHQNSHQRLK